MINFGPDIISYGLVNCIDAANIKSYPGIGTTWHDLCRNSTATLLNGAQYDSAKLGNIQTSAANTSRVTLTKVPANDFTPLDSFTMSVWARVSEIEQYPSQGVTSNCSIFGRGAINNSVGIGMSRSYDGLTYNWMVGSRAVSSIAFSVPYEVNRIDCITFVYTPTFYYVYRNGILMGTRDTSEGVGGSFQNADYLFFGDSAVPGGNRRNVGGNLFNALMYNRDLSSQQVFHNFNVMKDRFII